MTGSLEEVREYSDTPSFTFTRRLQWPSCFTRTHTCLDEWCRRRLYRYPVLLYRTGVSVDDISMSETEIPQTFFSLTEQKEELQILFEQSEWQVSQVFVNSLWEIRGPFPDVDTSVETGCPCFGEGTLRVSKRSLLPFLTKMHVGWFLRTLNTNYDLNYHNWSCNYTWTEYFGRKKMTT